MAERLHVEDEGLVDTNPSWSQGKVLLQLYFRNVSARDHNKANQSVCHVDFNGCAVSFRSFPRLFRFCGSLYGGRGRHAVFERVCKNNVPFLGLVVLAFPRDTLCTYPTGDCLPHRCT